MCSGVGVLGGGKRVSGGGGEKGVRYTRFLLQVLPLIVYVQQAEDCDITGGGPFADGSTLFSLHRPA